MTASDSRCFTSSFQARNSSQHQRSVTYRSPTVSLLLFAVGLLVPSLDVHLTDDLAVAHLEGLRGEHLKPIGVLARLVECYAILAYDLILDAVRHVSAANIFEAFGDRLFAAQHLR